MFNELKFNLNSIIFFDYIFYILLFIILLMIVLFLIIYLLIRSISKSYNLKMKFIYVKYDKIIIKLESKLLNFIGKNLNLHDKIKKLEDIQIYQYSGLTGILNNRIDNLGQKVNQNLIQNQKNTFDSLSNINSRLSLIDNAQKNIVDLSLQVISLQDILNNKQSRGAFGQGQMEAIIMDGLPTNAYDFQTTLSNGKRPDCLIRLPNQVAAIVIDAKFPLEGFKILKKVKNKHELKTAKSQIRSSIKKHINDIYEKYFIPGETQDTAIMFVPSESIFIEIHENFDDLIQESHRKRIFITSPNILMLAIHTIQSILKNFKMREQSNLIQNKVSKIITDVYRLNDRVINLSKHFSLIEKDILAIQTSTTKIFKHGKVIDSFELSKEIINKL